jgi:hypothetical protein
MVSLTAVDVMTVAWKTVACLLMHLDKPILMPESSEARISPRTRTVLDMMRRYFLLKHEWRVKNVWFGSCASVSVGKKG